MKCQGVPDVTKAWKWRGMSLGVHSPGIQREEWASEGRKGLYRVWMGVGAEEGGSGQAGARLPCDLL